MKGSERDREKLFLITTSLLSLAHLSLKMWAQLPLVPVMLVCVCVCVSVCVSVCVCVAAEFLTLRSGLSVENCVSISFGQFQSLCDVTPYTYL